MPHKKPGLEEELNPDILDASLDDAEPKEEEETEEWSDGKGESEEEY
mgnify:CR=1 FL=1